MGVLFSLLAAVTVIAVLVLAAALVLIGILGTVLVLVIHNVVLQKSIAGFRYDSLSRDSGFILGFEKNAGCKSCDDSSGYSAGSCI